MTPEERKDAASKAGKALWAKRRLEDEILLGIIHYQSNTIK
jgi:hypothetical protein